MTRRACTCAGTAPGYPQHESYCDLLTGRSIAADERAAEARTPAIEADDPWADVPALVDAGGQPIHRTADGVPF